MRDIIIAALCALLVSGILIGIAATCWVIADAILSYLAYRRVARLKKENHESTTKEENNDKASV